MLTLPLTINSSYQLSPVCFGQNKKSSRKQQVDLSPQPTPRNKLLKTSLFCLMLFLAPAAVCLGLVVDNGEETSQYREADGSLVSSDTFELSDN